MVSAELLDDKVADGVAGAGETIRVTLDRALPPGFRPQEVKVWSGPPPTPLLVQVRRSGPRTLEIELVSTPPPGRTEGSYSGNPTVGGPAGLGLDLGSAAPGQQWVDLQVERVHPWLERAVWDDRPAAGSSTGNLVVDQGDWIRLTFSREVRLAGPGAPSAVPPELKGAGGKEGGEAPGAEARVEARVPFDLLLTKAEDQLDDGKVRSYFRQGDHPREIVIVLGSNPRLTIAGRHRPTRRGGERERGPFWPSGLAVNGTPVLPLEKIVARRGGLGAVSSGLPPSASETREGERGGSVDIEFPEEYPSFEKETEERFPLPGHRTLPTITPIAGGRAIVAGGRSPGDKAIGQVLLYDPEATHQLELLGEMPSSREKEEKDRKQAEDKEAAGGWRLAAGDKKPPPGRYLHTATLFPGQDGLLGTSDDFVVIAGGTDGERSLGSLVAVRLLDPTSPEPFSIELLPTGLRVPREYHSAAFIPPDMLYLEGGRYTAPSGG